MAADRDAQVSANLADVRHRLARAAARVGRDPSSIRLIAVSKTHPVEDVLAAVRSGQLAFGENKVQEALQKIAASSDMPIEWHLIGHLQSNKARKAAVTFAWIHSVDRIDLLTRIDDAADEAGRRLTALVQVDLAGEPTKHGAAVDAVLRVFDAASRCRAVAVRGLMVLPPYADDPETARPYFRELRALRDHLADRGVPPAMLTELSMGMSHDFEVAIEEGATIVRVGTSIFGART